MELRRGTIVLLVLCCLEEPCYGYSLSEVLAEKGVAVEGNTLYPLLRRLAAQGFLTDAWDTSGSKPRKYYRVTEAGRQMRRTLSKEWRRLSEAVDKTLSEVLEKDTDREETPDPSERPL